MAENQNATLTNEELVALVQKQGDMIATLQLQIAGNKGAELKEAAKEVKPTLPKEPVEHEGKKYQFVMPAFRIGGEEFTAEQASVDSSIMDKILKVKGQNIMREVV